MIVIWTRSGVPRKTSMICAGALKRREREIFRARG